MEDLKNLVEDLATKLVEADPNNLQDLAGLQAHFQRVSDEAGGP